MHPKRCHVLLHVAYAGLATSPKELSSCDSDAYWPTTAPEGRRHRKSCLDNGHRFGGLKDVVSWCLREGFHE